MCRGGLFVRPQSEAGIGLVRVLSLLAFTGIRTSVPIQKHVQIRVTEAGIRLLCS